MKKTAICLLPLVLAGCEQISPKITVKVKIVEPCDAQGVMQDVNSMQVIAVDAEGTAQDATLTSKSAGGSEMSGLTIDNGTTVFVNGLAGEGAAALDALPVASGASIPIDLLGFQESSGMPAARNYPKDNDAAVIVPIGKVNTFGSTTELTDAAGTPSCSSMLEGRHGHTATYLQSIGKVLIIGGLRWTSDAPPKQGFVPEDRAAELYDPSTGKFDPAAIEARFQPLMMRAFHSATALPDGRVLVWGGIGPEGDGTKISTRAVSFILDPAATGDGQVTQLLTGQGYTIRRFHHKATLTNSGTRVVITGGCGCTATGVGGALTVEQIKSGMCPVEGDTTGDCSGVQVYPAPVDIFDVERATATAIGSGGLAHPRAFHSAVPLTSEQVVVVGGDNGQAPVAQIEIVNILPTAQVLPSTDTLATAAVTHAAAVRLNEDDCAKIDITHPRNHECVLVTGGCQRVLTSGECAEADVQTGSSLLDLGKASQRVSEGPAAFRARYDHEAYSLANGDAMVVIFGGRFKVQASDSPPVSAEILRRSGTAGAIPFVGAPPGMKNPRYRGATAALPSGQLFISGGVDSVGTGAPTSLSSAELFFFPFRVE